MDDVLRIFPDAKVIFLWRNPLAIAFPAAEPIPANELAAFARSSEPLLSRLNLLKNSDLALLE